MSLPEKIEYVQISQGGDVLNEDELVRRYNAFPEMLEALRATVTRLGIRDDFVPLGAALDLADVLRAAIAKAEGGEG